MNASYKDFHKSIILEWIDKSLQNPPFSNIEAQSQQEEDEDTQYILTEDTAIEDSQEDSEALYAKRLRRLQRDPTQENTKDIGQWLITTAVAKYAHLVPLIPRDLFWYFGGDCMHYLGDEEIASFQRLDEEFYSSDESCNYLELRNKLLGLH